MLEDIKKDIEKLIALYEAEKEKNSKLNAELDQCTSANESYRKQITELEQQIENLKLTEAFQTGGGDSSAAKEKIERMIREIDKCISVLES